VKVKERSERRRRRRREEEGGGGGGGSSIRILLGCKRLSRERDQIGTTDIGSNIRRMQHASRPGPRIVTDADDLSLLAVSLHLDESLEYLVERRQLAWRSARGMVRTHSV
jgi:hypothetical protein